MEKRLLLALLLAAIVIILSQKLFPTPPAARHASRVLDSIAPSGDESRGDTVTGATREPLATRRAAEPAIRRSSLGIISVPGDRVQYRLSDGAQLVSALLSDYKALPSRNRNVDLARPSTPLLTYQLVIGAADTVPLSSMDFAIDSTDRTSGRMVRFISDSTDPSVEMRYSVGPESYLVHVSGRVTGSPQHRAGVLLVTMPQGLASAEADSVDDERNLAFVVKPVRDDARSISFGKLDTLVPHSQAGPLRWVASKNKYFLLALLTDSLQRPFSGASFIGVARNGKVMTSADATVSLPLDASGEFSFDVYTGPQEWRRLHALGRDLEHVNPYGGILRGVVEPFATMVLQVLLWMHDHLRMSYGWVVVIFGVGVRLLLWPLNQSAMRNSLKLQRVQPELQAVQKKYRSNPEKQYAEIQRVYREHGLSPLTPVAGCLPMLIPMPVLFALYFVFQNTIEFRGVPFLWIVDISQRDPLFVLPIVMGVSMFVLSWIGLRSSPPNPQAKMMAYVFPVVMVFFFWRLAAGLNLYYAVQNIAALPQQWLIAQERAKATVARVT